jgi:hypothetical protein
VSLEQVKEIANAVLYEGYLLYPYRQSAIKNRQRWTFGVVYPQEYSEANGGIEPWEMQTECLVTGVAGTMVDVHVRFLHLLLRTVEQQGNQSKQVETPGASEWGLASHFTDEPREEGIEREIAALNLSLNELVDGPHTIDFIFPGERKVEMIGEDGEKSTGTPVSMVIRKSYTLEGTISIAAKRLEADLFKLTVRIENRTPETGKITNQRNAIMLHSLISTHTILTAHRGAFVSLLDPPEPKQETVKECVNKHTWPVLAGDESTRDNMLSSPIILYDYPQIAPESPGALFDGTEIDEILTLRIMTLTDEEKAAMRQEDERVREILERTENLTPEEFMKLHGTIRTRRPVEGEASG